MDLTPAQIQRLGQINRGQVVNVIDLGAVPVGSILAVAYAGSGNVRWFEIVEPEPTFKYAWDTGA